VIFNLLLLGFFKYWDFFAANLSLIPGASTCRGSGTLKLPIGISFYTFQTMSYTIDVYRRDAPAQRNPITFGTFVTMFPQLIAGPIVKLQGPWPRSWSRRTSPRRRSLSRRRAAFLRGPGEKGAAGQLRRRPVGQRPGRPGGRAR
jgi:D-alanyl-lipoteichoic acid acyltransferase DltB (MBOAT superfamily)